jgi:hypothetical protein
MSRIDFVTGAPERYIGDVRALGAIPDRLRSVLAGHTTAQLRRALAEGEWPPVRVLAHLLSHARHSGEFIQLIASMQEPTLVPWDEAEEVERERWERLDGGRLLALLRAEVEGTVELLSVTPDASWGRPGIHPLGGRRSLRQQVRAHIRHLESHIEQIEQALADQPAPLDARR